MASSKKNAARNLLQIVRLDCRSNTGKNCRTAMLFCGSNNPRELVKEIEKMPYQNINKEDGWRIPIIEELLDIRDHYADGIGWKREEVKECIDYICTS